MENRELKDHHSEFKGKIFSSLVARLQSIIKMKCNVSTLVYYYSMSNCVAINISKKTSDRKEEREEFGSSRLLRRHKK